MQQFSVFQTTYVSQCLVSGSRIFQEGNTPPMRWLDKPLISSKTQIS